MATANEKRASVIAMGMVNASVSGIIGLRILILNAGGATARWETGEGLQTQTIINSGIVPTSVDPQVILALSFGGTGNSTATISSSADAICMTMTTPAAAPF